MASVYVSADSYLDEVTYVSGDDIYVQYGATLTIRESNTIPFRKISTSDGTIFINSSATGATTPIVLTGTNQNGVTLQSANRGTIKVRGGWYDLGTGDGTAGQTFTFYHTHGKPAWVQVETGADTDEWIDCVCLSGYSLSLVGSGNVLGRFFNYTEATQTITFGDGTNGIVVPNGARVRCPDILLDTEAGEVTYGSRGELSSQYVGTWDIDTMLCSDRIFVYCLRTSNPIVKRMGCFSYSEISQNLGGLFDTFIVAPDPSSATQYNYFQYNTGTVVSNSIYSVMSQRAMLSYMLIDCIFNDTSFYVIDRTSTAHETVNLVSCFGNTFNDINSVGSRIYLSGGTNDTTFNGISSSDKCNGVKTTALSVDVLKVSGGSNLKVNNLTKVPGGCPPYGYMFTLVYCSNIEIVDVDYDCEGHTGQVLYNTNIPNILAARFSVGDVSSALINTYGSTGANCRFYDILATSTGAISKILGRNIHAQGVAVGGYNTSFIGSFDLAWYLLYDPDTTITTGKIYVPFVQELNFSNISYINGAYHDNSATIHIPATDDGITFEIPDLILGVSGFSATDPTVVGQYATTLSHEYAIKLAGGSWSAWKTLNGTNLSAETVSASTGFYLKFRFIGLSDSGGRTLQELSLPITVDPTVKRPIDFVDIVLDNIIVGSTYRIEKVSDGSLIAEGTASSNTETINVEYSSDTAVNVVVRYSTAGTRYKPFKTGGTITSSGLSSYISQVADEVLNG